MYREALTGLLALLLAGAPYAQSASLDDGGQQVSRSSAAQEQIQPPTSEANPNSQNEPVLQPRQSGPVLQQRSEEPTYIPMARTVQVGTEFLASIDQALSSTSSHTGQSFTATLSQPLSNSNGQVLIPAGAKINAEVTEAEAGKVLPSIRGKGRLNLRFRSIILSDGTTAPLQATLLGIQSTSGKASAARSTEEGDVTGSTSGTQIAKNVGIGAGIGTVAGLLLGGALKGLAVGVLAGGGYVLAEGGKDVELPAQTTVKLRLDQNLTLPSGSNMKPNDLTPTQNAPLPAPAK